MKFAAASILALNVLAGGGHEGHGSMGMAMDLNMKEKSSKWSVIKNKASIDGYWLVEKYGVWANAQGTPEFYAVTEIHLDPKKRPFNYSNHNGTKFVSSLTIG